MIKKARTLNLVYQEAEARLKIHESTELELTAPSKRK